MTYTEMLEEKARQAEQQEAVNKLPIAEAKAAIKDVADTAHAQYPQYQGRWDGKEWKLGQVTKRIRTKAGVAFEQGDIVIYTDETFPKFNPKTKEVEEKEAHTAYSIRNKINTSLGSRKHIKEISPDYDKVGLDMLDANL